MSLGSVQGEAHHNAGVVKLYLHKNLKPIVLSGFPLEDAYTFTRSPPVYLWPYRHTLINSGKA